MLNSEALAFPRYDLPFCLAVQQLQPEASVICFNQKHPDSSGKEHMTLVVRFGSKSLSKWQQSYGPTKLELLGMVTSILDCAGYLRGRQFIVECDHQGLKPLFQKSLKGAIYERWLAILQEFNFEICYKPAAQTVVPDALSRCIPGTNDTPQDSSPDETDQHFPYVHEQTGKITFPNGTNLRDMLCQEQVNHTTLPRATQTVVKPDTDYDADTEMDCVSQQSESLCVRTSQKD